MLVLFSIFYLNLDVLVLEKNIQYFVVEEGENPSTDYFVLPYLHKNKIQFERVSFGQIPPKEKLKGATILFVRYVPPAWKAVIEKYRSSISAIYLFMDDDLLSWRSFGDMPLRYQAKLLRYSWLNQRWLRSIGAKLLVSTPWLQQKYTEWEPILLKAQPINFEVDEPQTVFYHGSASHYKDLCWLYPIIEESLQRNQNMIFEVIGDKRVNKLFRSLSRVQVLYPMRWPAYRSLIRRPGRHIGLAPLLDTPFNRARSHTKFFDITQAGAVGIYTEGSVYATVVRHEENGLLLPMEPEVWVEAILRLAEDQSLRQRMLEEARQCL
ncbi:glycosyltransferase family 1 protein [Microbulbifer sp. 2205BS26-8]|uniref:glycosyltransferase family 1 protein n=1 Tax=Microbulbifer sp. 2205BS26-8 TaxID=3064386 RepID=UPI00273D2979|nr:glycosyltransferase family 1 protein [Microbulbifer sp. 2205BS26-8]MDP5211233.1 glycosyltransferase family 1 protein [Microbulbifer sp. 2205BS26-8]